MPLSVKIKPGSSVRASSPRCKKKLRKLVRVMQDNEQMKSEVESRRQEKMVRSTLDSLEETVRQSQKKLEILIEEEVEGKRVGLYDAKRNLKKFRELYLSVFSTSCMYK